MKWACMTCGKQYAETGRAAYYCECGVLLDIRHDFAGVDTERLKAQFAKRLAERNGPYASGVWRYKELILPELDDRHIVTKYEGNTGLYASEAIGRYAGIRTVWLKALSENPSGSFKDHGMTAAVSYGRSLGYRRFACSSTGNTSSSLAMYAAFAGLESYVLLPGQGISLNKVLQTLAYGAKVLTIEGTYDDGVRFCEEHGEVLGLYVCNSINPVRIEGQKSIVYEIAQTLKWQLPDWIVLPGGALSNATALGKGLADLHRLGFIGKLPRVAIVQAEGASPFHRMARRGDRMLVPEPRPHTRASALNIGHPPSWRKALHYVLEQTDGVTVSVSDEEIMDAKAHVDASGIGCEPASAAAVAGLRKLARERCIDKDETAVCLLTGHMLKDTDALREYHIDEAFGARLANRIMPVRLTPEEVSRHLGEM
ncbi:threonine synthase [Paenibacillus hamazuiensis]|uniref:threonine synthase n=1 Tax=Paenibacillus hamazuiensis TaxID=2936508 RepID=UPI0020108CD2|nr:threonine synthase [Paenibacillus hamazuiensis]